MQLEHLNLVVTDIDRSLGFYRALFPHWRIRDRGHGEWYGKPRTWVHFGDDYQYLVFSDHGEGDNRALEGHQVGLAHFAFTTHHLDGAVERLRLAGFSPSHDGNEEPHRRNVYYIDPDGFEIELVQYLSDLPEERNLSS